MIGSSLHILTLWGQVENLTLFETWFFYSWIYEKLRRIVTMTSAASLDLIKDAGNTRSCHKSDNGEDSLL